MHEFGYVESLIPVVEQRAGGRPVTGLGVRAGVLHRLVDDSFQMAFEAVAAGTVAEGATIELEQVPVDVACSDCGHEATADEQTVLCPSCGSASVENRNGDEFLLHWLRYAET